MLRAHRVPPQRLVLEVTEHAVATDMEELIRRLRRRCAPPGVRIALDDFGAGYSSLGQLRRLPVDILKIDHALVAEPESARPARRAPMVDVVVRLGHRLGLEVIAEGIGDAGASGAVVEEAGCRLGQGSLFGWGVPAEHLEAQLRRCGLPVPGRSGAARPRRRRRGAGAQSGDHARPGDAAAQGLLPADQASRDSRRVTKCGIS